MPSVSGIYKDVGQFESVPRPLARSHEPAILSLILLIFVFIATNQAVCILCGDTPVLDQMTEPITARGRYSDQVEAGTIDGAQPSHLVGVLQGEQEVGYSRRWLGFLWPGLTNLAGYVEAPARDKSARDKSEASALARVSRKGSVRCGGAV